VIERRIALAQRYHIAKALENGQQLAEPPNSRLVHRLRRAAPLSPEPLERPRVGTVVAPALLQPGYSTSNKLSAHGAAEVRLRLRARKAGPASNTA
jgi:hypothetical protein